MSHNIFQYKVIVFDLDPILLLRGGWVLKCAHIWNKEDGEDAVGEELVGVENIGYIGQPVMGELTSAGGVFHP